MLTFGIIGEGVTDQVVIENILKGYFRDDNPEANYVQPPPMDASRDQAPPHAGWDLVFKSIKRGDHIEAMTRNDYVIIQIDTDVSEQTGYGVPHHDGGRELTVSELTARVVDKLIGLMGTEFHAEHAGKFIFAIAVHSTECWLMPLLHDDNRTAKVTGCLVAANEVLKRRNRPPLSKPGRRGEEKDPRSYRSVSREYANRKQLMARCDRNPSLAIFVKNLAALDAGPGDAEVDPGPGNPSGS